ncbi:unnamed protein product, partial [Amoebophrya sp. A25]
RTTKDESVTGETTSRTTNNKQTRNYTNKLSNTLDLWGKEGVFPEAVSIKIVLDELEAHSTSKADWDSKLQASFGLQDPGATEQTKHFKDLFDNADADGDVQHHDRGTATAEGSSTLMQPRRDENPADTGTTEQEGQVSGIPPELPIVLP